MSDFTTFDYVDLNEIDPNPDLLPEGMYELRVVRAELRSGVSQRTGDPYQAISLSLAVVNHDQYTGRRVFETLFPNANGLKALRRLMDATGIQQQPGEPVVEWLQRLVTEQAQFKALVREIEERDPITKQPRMEGDRVVKRNAISWFKVMPA